MNANNTKVQSLIETTFVSAINKLTANEACNLVSDIYIQVDQKSGELEIFDDEENLLEKKVIYEWLNNDDPEETFIATITPPLKAVTTLLVAKNAFDKPVFLKPLSVSLTDEDFVVIEELLFLDDDTFRADDPLLKDLDEELDDFLAKLLSDVK